MAKTRISDPTLFKSIIAKLTHAKAKELNSLQNTVYSGFKQPDLPLSIKNGRYILDRDELTRYADTVHLITIKN